MLRILTTALLAAFIAGSAQAQTWTDGNITYRKHGNMIYGSDGSIARRSGDTVSLITRPPKYHGPTVCQTYADRIVCN